MSYNDWKEKYADNVSTKQARGGIIDNKKTIKFAKTINIVSKTNNEHKIADGKNLVGKFEITEDEKYDDGGINRIMELQGYKGNPRVVNDNEFEELTKESNFFAQRTYGGKDEHEAKEFQRQLYSGEWYIDCSVGGSQYGKGMYCAATYDISDQSKLDGIIEESNHYRKLAYQRKNKYAVTEDFTMDKTAKIIKDTDITREYIKQIGELDNWDGTEKDIYDSYNQLSQKKIKAYQDYMADWRNGKDTSKAIAEYKKYESELINVKSQFTSKMKQSYNSINGKDPSTLAVEMGYDAINAEGHGQSGSYTIILNRTKLIIRKGGYINVDNG